MSALSSAASNGQLAAVQLLLDRGADVNDDDFWGGNALVGASVSGEVGVVKLLLDYGSDPNMFDDGASALDYASHQLEDHTENKPLSNYVTIVQLLRSAGAHSAISIFSFL